MHAGKHGVVALRLGRNLTFDPVKQVLQMMKRANALIDQPMRGEWHL